MGKRKKRALVVIRLSRETDATTSPERQRQACEKKCAELGYEIVGEAEDLSVSAAISPFDRPKLKPWLKTPQRYDAIVFYRMDRIVRQMNDLSRLSLWGEENDVALISATEEHLNTMSEYSDVIRFMIGKSAEMELQAIRARNGSSSHYLIEEGRWRGGVPPWGYLPVKGDGVWRLEHDPVQVEVISEVVRRVLSHETLRSIANDLTERGVLTPRDRFAQSRGRTPKGLKWHPSPLKRSLESPTLLGRIVRRENVLDENGLPIRDAKGNRVLGEETVLLDQAGVPVVRAEPVLDKLTFDRVGKELQGRENRKEPSKRAENLLVQVIHCGECGQRAYRLKGGKGRSARYRCASAQYKTSCGNRTILLKDADKKVTDEVLSRLGPMERKVRAWSNGNDVASELAEVEEMIDDIAQQIGTRAFRRGTAAREKLDARLASLSKRREKLEATKVEEPGWRYEGTGQTVQQWWDAADVSERNLWLRQIGVKASWKSSEVADNKFRTKVDEIVVDMGRPGLDADELPGAIADLAEQMHCEWAGDPWFERLAGHIGETLQRDGDPWVE